ncbi:MAG: hypothetical protein IIB42_06760 [Candidatus Marinimicrobia bacterium]|nr:hypothetical protein [Candidatus Neomarinimicrobiota bacterium]
MFKRMARLAPAFLLSIISAQVSNVDWATQVHPILQDGVGQAGCAATGSCHGSGQAGLTITANAATTYDNIVNVVSGCNGLDYIEPDDPSASHLYKKIEGTPACGGRMPANNTSYFINNADQLALIRVWIEEGALPEAAPTEGTLTLDLTGMTPHLGQLFELRVVDQSDGSEVGRTRSAKGGRSA